VVEAQAEIGNSGLSFRSALGGEESRQYRNVYESKPMSTLAQQKVIDHGEKISHEEIKKLKQELNSAWELKEGKLFRHFDFKNFRQSKAFVDEISDIAEEAGHHPDIAFSFKYVDITLYTHFRSALTEADFIVGARIDALNT
jgi:4a-hydroxytetrahydrobiopterin dehydratase